ncbi:hypothetical protein [Salinifilum ghardaiensis]
MRSTFDVPARQSALSSGKITDTEGSWKSGAAGRLTQVRDSAPVRRLGAVQRIGKRLRYITGIWTGCVTVNIKKILTWTVVAFLLFFLFSSPTQASDLVTGILGSLRSAAQSVITFMENLFV